MLTLQQCTLTLCSSHKIVSKKYEMDKRAAKTRLFVVSADVCLFSACTLTGAP
jgi:hypothetical protein